MGSEAEKVAADTVQSGECPARAGDATTGGARSAGISPGIRRSQEAFRRDLPRFLEDKKLHRRWVAYARGEFIGFSHSQAALYEECLRRGINEEDFIIGYIVP